jgi:hypothetical protein
MGALLELSNIFMTMIFDTRTSSLGIFFWIGMMVYTSQTLDLVETQPMLLVVSRVESSEALISIVPLKSRGMSLVGEQQMYTH